MNLFINGSYKGYYNPTERIDDDFMRSWHGGDNDWDVIAQFGEVREGNSSEWNSMRTIVGRDMTIPANYQAALDVLDLDNFIDYLITNVYGGTGDWPHNNWRAARERVAGAKFRFYAWDAEWSFGQPGALSERKHPYGRARRQLRDRPALPVSRAKLPNSASAGLTGSTSTSSTVASTRTRTSRITTKACEASCRRSWRA